MTPLRLLLVILGAYLLASLWGCQSAPRIDREPVCVTADDQPCKD